MSLQTPQSHQHGEIRTTNMSAIHVGTHNPLNPHHLNAQAHNNNYRTSDFNVAPVTPPRTPQHMQGNPPQHNTHAKCVTNNNTPKPKNNTRPNRNRPKNVNISTSCSPAVQHIDQNRASPSSTTPMPITMSATDAVAYAGPTFHASPAPSALPIPSFYSKSVPASIGIDALHKSRRADASSPGISSPLASKSVLASNGSVSANTTPSIAVAQPAQPDETRIESPLDFIFNAHRQESARGAPSPKTNANTGAFPAASPIHNHVTPSTSNKAGHRASESAKSVFTMELDGGGHPRSPIGPAFSTPYQERMNAARASTARATTSPTTAVSPAIDRTQAMKDFLFSQKPASPSTLSFADLPASSTTGNRHSSEPLRTYNMNQHNNMLGINNPARTGSRSSNLRREIEITPTKSPIDKEHQQFTQPQLAPDSSRYNVLQSPVYGYGENREMLNRNVNAIQSPSRPPRAQQDSDVRELEDNLRRLLKIGPSGNGT